MTLYLLYRLGYFIANKLSIKAAYRVACAIADIHFYLSPKERNAVIKNLSIILNRPCHDKELRPMAREVTRNFAKYLVDFFRFPTVDDDYIRRFVKVDGIEYVDEGLSKNRGVIVLSAHIGNWELGGLVLSLMRHPMKAVVLTHQNKRINDFFTKQRSLGNMRPVEIGFSLRSCYEILKNNGLLALLGDRDFSKNGFYVDFFGKKALIPKGPAVFSYRVGSCIVPCFMIREKNDTFRLIFEKPIFPDPAQDEDTAIQELIRKYSSAIETYVKRYPTQWYMFREVWNNGKKCMHPDTII